MAKTRGKKYQDALKKVEAKKQYALTDAVELVKDIDFANFDATIEVAFNLNVDTKQADQQLRGAVVLPNGLLCPIPAYGPPSTFLPPFSPNQKKVVKRKQHISMHA